MHYKVGLDWDSKNITPNLRNLKESELLVGGVPFVSLNRLCQWKAWKNLPKHLFELSNKSDFESIAKLFTPSTTYSSQNTGIFLGVDDIVEM